MKIAKLILWIVALVLTAALGFSVISLSVRGSGKNTSETVTKNLKSSQKFSGGLPSKDLFKFETKIKKAGTYRITIDPTTSYKTFVIGSEVYDSDGKLIGAMVLLSGEESKADYKFTEGTCSILFRYLTTEQDLRDFIEEYDATFNAKSIREFVSKVHFSDFNQNGTVTFNCKVSIGKAPTSRIGLIDVYAMIALGLSLIAVTIVLGVLYKQKKPTEPEVYDGKAPEVPETRTVKPAAQPVASPVQYAYRQHAYPYPAPAAWMCNTCGYNMNVGRFCANCGQPRLFMPAPAYQAPAYQQPTYQLPSYTVPAQQYPAPATYQMPMQPVQYAQPVYAPVPAQPAFVPAYTAVPKPDYSAKPKKPEPAPADPEFVDGLKNLIPAIGARYAAFCVVFLLVQLAGAYLLSLLVPDFVRQYKTSLSMGLTVLAVDVIGFPFIWLLLKGIPKVKLEKHNLSFAQWFGFLMMTEGLMMVGSMVGSPIHTALTQPFNGETISKATSMIQNSHILVSTIGAGICAPIFEELIFRKVLIDRTIRYGEYVSIVTSGIMFGLLHGNFQQFFFAALVGMLFAYVYIRTGRIRYTIFLHMAINLSSSLVMQTLLKQVLDAREKGNYNWVAVVCAIIMLCWAGGLIAIGIMGIVRIIKGLKRKTLALNMRKGEPTHKEVRSFLLKDKALWLYIAMTIVLFLHSYLINIIIFFVSKSAS